jgi:hypothetical protein
MPADDGPSQLADLGRTRRVLEIVTELSGGLGCGFGVVDVIDGPDQLFAMPGGLDLTSWVARLQQAEHLRLPRVVEASLGHDQQLAGPIQRIVSPAPVSEGLVGDSPSALVELVVRQPNQVERVGDLGDVVEGTVEHGPVRPGQVQKRHSGT